jgi:hypothetical protein
METYMWRDTDKGKYILQTDDPTIHQKLKKRKDAVLIGNGINCNLWIYKIEHYSLKDFRKEFSLSR